MLGSSDSKLMVGVHMSQSEASLSPSSNTICETQTEPNTVVIHHNIFTRKPEGSKIYK